MRSGARENEKDFERGQASVDFLGTLPAALSVMFGYAAGVRLRRPAVSSRLTLELIGAGLLRGPVTEPQTVTWNRRRTPRTTPRTSSS